MNMVELYNKSYMEMSGNERAVYDAIKFVEDITYNDEGEELSSCYGIEVNGRRGFGIILPVEGATGNTCYHVSGIFGTFEVINEDPSAAFNEVLFRAGSFIDAFMAE